MRVPMTLAADMFAARKAFNKAEDALIVFLSGLGVVVEDFTVDEYDGSIEIYLASTPPAAIERVICEQGGFDRVWLHQHAICGHGGCECPCWTLSRLAPAPSR